jgi:DNA-binding response OmpR family regulator
MRGVIALTLMREMAAMPEVDGFGVCHPLSDRRQVPIIMLSAYGEVADKVRRLNLGADDFITKPTCC